MNERIRIMFVLREIILMWKSFPALFLLGFLISINFYNGQAWAVRKSYRFLVKEASYTRLCSTKKILTVNGKFPGPTLYAYKGDTLIVDVHNKGKYNITIHWHGVKQHRNPWDDGPEYITQCPIQPGAKFRQKVMLSTEAGTLWWHAHSDWSRATVHGAIVVYPERGTDYPFNKPDAEIPMILGEWWKSDVMEVLKEFVDTGGNPQISDANTINGQPGDMYPCSKDDTFKLSVRHGKTYLLRIVNAALNQIFFFSVAKHKLKVVGTDGQYTKPLKRKLIIISPGQTIDVLLHAKRRIGSYYVAARAYSSGYGISFDNTTTTAIIEYPEKRRHSSLPQLPKLPNFNDTLTFLDFTSSLRSLANQKHPVEVPLDIDTRILSTISVNAFPCRENETCDGPNGTRLAASLNNITFVSPSIDILQAYYNQIKGVYGDDFPEKPPYIFNFTADFLPLEFEISRRGREVRIIEYNSSVELIFQGTNVVAGLDHPMHLHGYSCYLVGQGLGNFDKDKDPLNYNLVDPPHINTVIVPKNGWVTLRFKASNPGVWFLHCHLERHLTWGMTTVFIVRNGNSANTSMLPPPKDMPPC